jgi:hypothetical protein
VGVALVQVALVQVALVQVQQEQPRMGWARRSRNL